MIQFDTSAERLFGNSTPSAPAVSPAAEPLPMSDEALGALIYGGDTEDLATDELKADRAASDPARSMFADGDCAEIRTPLDKAIETLDPDLPTVERQAQVAEYVHIGNDLGLGKDQMVEIASQIRNDVVRAGPEMRASWAKSAAKIADSYGQKREAVVAEAQRMVRSNPALTQMLATTGLGDHPSLVRHVLASAAQRLKGR